MMGLYVPANAPWYADLRAELLSFPAGKYDDQVDALGLAGQLLDVMLKGSKPSRNMGLAQPRTMNELTLNELYELQPRRPVFPRI